MTADISWRSIETFYPTTFHDEVIVFLLLNKMFIKGIVSS